jgi:hypothetical protein
MNGSEFIYGLISGVLATLVGFVFAAAWDLWKEGRNRKDDRRKRIRLLRQEVGANVQILDANCELLERDTELAKERREIV